MSADESHNDGADLGQEASQAHENQMEQLKSKDQPMFGKRILVDLTIGPTIREICEDAKKMVPEPIWPDPDKEPLPAPVIH